MANYNKVILAGNLTREPQLSYTANNTAVCEFGLAINRRWRGQDGNVQDETCFVDCQLYGRQAETFNQYMSKGRPVLLEGRLRYRQWTTPEGDRRSKLSVLVERFVFIDTRAAAGAGTPEPPGAAPAEPRPAPSEPVGAGPDSASPADDDPL